MGFLINNEGEFLSILTIGDSSPQLEFPFIVPPNLSGSSEEEEEQRDQTVLEQRKKRKFSDEQGEKANSAEDVMCKDLASPYLLKVTLANVQLMWDVNANEVKSRNPPIKWTPEEDEKLTNLVKTTPESNNRWTQIGRILNRPPSQCCTSCEGSSSLQIVVQHWMRVLNPDINKGLWTDDEEETMLGLVQSAGPRRISWSKLSSKIPGRTGTNSTLAVSIIC